MDWSLTDFSDHPLWVNLIIFAIAAAAVWFAGTRLAQLADDIAKRTGLGHALIGMLLLGGITSLPEIAVAVSAGLTGNAALGVNNMFGGVALQVVIIAIGDAMLRRRALSFVVASPSVLLQGVFCCALLCAVIGAIATGDRAIAGVGVWSTAIFFSTVGLIWLVAKFREDQALAPTNPADIEHIPEDREEPRQLSHAIFSTFLVALVIVAAGYALTLTGEALAEQTGLGSSFVGAIFVALATSLPEISTVYAAVRLRRYVMAFSDIFGTNMIDIALIFIIDLTYSGPPVLNEVGAFSTFAAALAALVTLVYVAGLIERKDAAAAGLGIDSWIVVALYAGGVAALYGLK